MPKINEFRIVLERPGATYAPGEAVTGKIELSLSKPKNVREIRLEGRGVAEVHWTRHRKRKNSSGSDRSYTEHYRGSEHYFSVSNRLIGGGDGSTTLPAGHHTYHFTFQLPQNIPCSFEHEHGHVRYTVKAVLDRPWRFDHKIVSAFTVVAPFDLNIHHIAAAGINDQFSKNYYNCCCCFSAGGTRFKISNNVAGFVPGETINMIVHYDNYSDSVNLTKMKMTLLKTITFYASSPHSDKKQETIVIRKNKIPGPFNKKGETCLKIEVPSLPPSNLEHCSVINISYKLIVDIGVSGWHYDISRSYPIHIGTIPLYNQSSNVSHNSVTPYIPSAPPVDQIDLVPVPGPQSMQQQIGFVVMNAPPYSFTAQQAPYPITAQQPMPEIPPPSYEECMSGSNMISDQNEQGMHGPSVQFTPKYPVYKFPMPTPCKSNS